jgi:phage shock protein C
MAKNKIDKTEEVKVKRLYRSNKDRMLWGVCGGIAEYLEVDPTIIRLLWVLGTLASFGFGIVLYIISAIIIPRKSRGRNTE